MDRQGLISLIKRKQSFLCVGLDTQSDKLPDHLKGDPFGFIKFNKAIIKATLPYTVSYKLNIAFYEAMGAEGWKILDQTIKSVPKGEALIIADAKRGDIGNTAVEYAKAFFDVMDFDAITINPYMGHDSITPFLEYKNKWAIVLGLTSNSGAFDVELLKLEDGRYVFEAAMQSVSKLGAEENLMFVVGATKPDFFQRIRTIAPNHFLLVPGVGAQGGSLSEIEPLMTKDCGVLVNSSRQVIYASSGKNYAQAAAEQAAMLQQKMAAML